MLLGTLDASLLGNILTGRGINRSGEGKGINRTGEGIVRADYGGKMDFLCRPIFELILKYKNIIKMSLDVMVFILEIILPK